MSLSTWLLLAVAVVAATVRSASAAVLKAAPVATGSYQAALVEMNLTGTVSDTRRSGGATSQLRLRRQPFTQPYLPVAKHVPFFTEDPIEMAEAQPGRDYEHKNASCHPKCTWECDAGGVNCPTKCTPLCKAPECATVCQKPLLSQCHSVCQDPKCALICPPMCPNGGCPECYTVCSEPKCEMVCGHNFCESKCADPVCAWNCTIDKSACPEPACRMSCEAAKCLKNPFLDTRTGPNPHEAAYAGQEVAWQGLAKIPKSMKKIMTPMMAEGSSQWYVPAPAEEAEDSPEGGDPSVSAT